MTDTYTNTNSASTPASTQPVPSTSTSATDRLDALLEELRAEQLKPVPPQVDQVPVSQPLPITNVASLQPTVEEQLQMSKPSSLEAYAQLMQKVGQKYSQSKPTLTDLLGLFDLVPAAKKTITQSSFQVSSEPLPPLNVSAPVPAVAEPPASLIKPEVPTTQSPQLDSTADPRLKSRAITTYMQKLSANLKQFGKLNLTNFHVAN